MSYKLPGLVERLAERLRTLSPDAVTVVRHDARQCSLDGNRIRASGAEYRPSSSALLWGHWTMVEAQLNELRYIREAHPEVDRVVFLSGQDYPIRRLEPWEQGLDVDFVGEISPVAARLRWGREMPDGDHHAPRAMYRYYRLPVPPPLEDRTTRVLRMFSDRLRPLIDVRCLAHGSGVYFGVRRRLPFQMWWGYPWVALSSAAVDSILQADDYARHFRRAIIPEEHFMHCVVANDPAFKVRSEAITASVWTHAHARHPEVVTSQVLGDVVRSAAPFARKFDDRVDPGVLDIIDARVDRPEFV